MIRISTLAPAACAAVAMVALGACGSSESGGDAPETFLAFSATFAPFRSWTSFHSDGPIDDGTFPPDVLGPRTQYINTPPPPGSLEFPIGTVIVEARESGTMKIFAAVKRGETVQRRRRDELGVVRAAGPAGHDRVARRRPAGGRHVRRRSERRL